MELVRWGFMNPIAYTAWAVNLKMQGNGEHCTWSRVLTSYPDHEDFRTRIQLKRIQEVKEFDASRGIELISVGGHDFWIRRQGSDRNGGGLLNYLFAEHEWIASRSHEASVRKGDIVLDCGAHVGVFTRQALDLGAEKVVAIDPDPTQVECLRRNFEEEIASGRVVVAPKGLWSSEGSMSLHVGVLNSGISSLVIERGGEDVEVALTTIDQLVSDLRLPRVDYIKLDIEGAEREALRGARRTLANHRPRILLESYHRHDDLEVLPRIIAEAQPDYKLGCGPCEPSEEFDGRLVPHYVYFE